MKIKQTKGINKLLSIIVIALVVFSQSFPLVAFASENKVDILFAQPSYDFNPELAKLSLELSTNAYGATSDNIEQLLSSLGFQNDTQFDANSYVKASEKNSNSVAYSFANKTINFEGKKYTLIAVVIRGTSGQNEWLSNFNINNSGAYPLVHEGFELAKEEVLSSLTSYASAIGSNKSTTKLLVTGHSRGAAVANLLASSLTDSETLANESNIYGYTFATPNVAIIDSQRYFNIFNAVDSSDVITQMPLQNWGYGKYGINYSTPNLELINQNNLKASQQLLFNLNALAPTVESFYKNKLIILFLEGSKIPQETMESHDPQSYMNWLTTADPVILKNMVIDLQLDLIPNNTYA